MTDIRLVYGIIETPLAALARERGRAPPAGGIGPLSARIVADTPAFRLNSPGWANAAPDIVQTLSGTDALTYYCRARLLNRVSVFSLLLRSFLAAYLDFAICEVERRREELEARLHALGLSGGEGFPTYRDWIFSALLPVPQVHLALPDGHGPVAVDVLFWTGRSAVALTLQGRTMPTSRQREAREALMAAHPGIRMAAMRAPADGRSWIFDEEFRALLEGVLLADAGLPFGPYRILPPV